MSNFDFSFDNIIKEEFPDDKPVENANPSWEDMGIADVMPSQSPPPPPADDNPFNDPEIIELQQQLTALMQHMNEYEPEVKALTEERKQANAEKKAFIVEVNKTILEFERRIMEADHKRRAIEAELEQAELNKKKILADIDHKLEAKRASQLLQEARDRWNKIIDEHDWLWAEAAREYQRVGIEFTASIVDRDLFGIGLLDEMGLGKTLQATGGLDLIRNHPMFGQRLAERLDTWDPTQAWTSSVLWVCPDSIKDQTQRELKRWSDSPVVVLDGPPGMRGNIAKMAHKYGATLIVGYAQLRDRKNQPVTPELFDLEWPIMVADEIQEARNENTSTFVNVKQLVQKAGFFIPMSGTPVENKAIEFWVILHLLTQKGKRAHEFPSSSNFESMYLGWGSKYFSAGQFDALMKRVSDMVLRRTKAEVMKDLPDKERSFRFVQMGAEQRNVYDMMRDRLYVWLDEQKSDAINATNFLAQLTYLRQINLLPSGVGLKNEDGSKTYLQVDESAKIDDAMGLIRLMMQQDQKVLIVSCFNHVLGEIQKRVADEGLTWTDDKGNDRPVDSGSITGKTPKKLKTVTQDRFNDPHDDMRVLVGNVKAMGLGLNLQGACSQMIFLDLYWNPGRNTQAEDRLHRMGQKNNVTIHIIQCEDSVDAFIAQIIEAKLDTFNAMFSREELRQALDNGLI